LASEVGTSADLHVDWVAWSALRTGWANDDGEAWLPNPSWVGRMPDEVVELQRSLLGITEAGAHWGLSHRGLEVGASGWAFVGRQATLTESVNWLDSSQGGVLVITGPPGSGKSAVLGRLVTLSVKEYRERAAGAGFLQEAVGAPLPRLGAFDAAV